MSIPAAGPKIREMLSESVRHVLRLIREIAETNLEIWVSPLPKMKSLVLRAWIESCIQAANPDEGEQTCPTHWGRDTFRAYPSFATLLDTPAFY